MIGYVYKLYRVGLSDFYIGSSFDIEKRKQKHKSNCTDKSKKCKVYQYIRANGGFDKWRYEILVEKEFENKTALRIKEQECINLLNPSLNTHNAYQTEEEYKRRKAVNDKKYRDKQTPKKIECICGANILSKKNRHEKTKKHQKYLQTINNITYNITTLNINN